MPTPFWTRLIIGLSAGLWLLIAFVLEVPVDKNWLKALGGIAAAIVAGLLIFDRWAWRWLPLSLRGHPKLHGTWKATLTFEEMEDGVPSGGMARKDCFLVIRQTYSTVTVNMLFDVSSSESRSAALCEQNGVLRLWFSYWSAAGALHRDGNDPHRGGAELVISQKPRLRLAGDYWTERRTRGHIETDGHSRNLYDDFASACEGEYS
jgi:SMODS-associating 2TM, beta-strand rich effector domain